MAIALLCLSACSAAPHPLREPLRAPPPSPGIALTLDFRGRTIVVDADGVLAAEGCNAARYDWEAQALLDLGGAPVLSTDHPREGERFVRSPDGTELMRMSGDVAFIGERPILGFDAEGMLSDQGTGGATTSIDTAVPEAHREATLSLLVLVGLCWETHPRALTEP